MAPLLRLIVGLGNPGRSYAATRHNAGAWFVERLALALGLRFESETRFHSWVARDRAAAGGDIRLVLPQDYMNESGYGVAALARFYRLSPPEILIAHDELDLKPGSVKLKLGGGSAGHNGLKDVIAQLGGGEFWRLRLGIGAGPPSVGRAGRRRIKSKRRVRPRIRCTIPLLASVQKPSKRGRPLGPPESAHLPSEMHQTRCPHGG